VPKRFAHNKSCYCNPSVPLMNPSGNAQKDDFYPVADKLPKAVCLVWFHTLSASVVGLIAVQTPQRNAR
jgi:hypothetical protein